MLDQIEEMAGGFARAMLVAEIDRQTGEALERERKMFKAGWNAHASRRDQWDCRCPEKTFGGSDLWNEINSEDCEADYFATQSAEKDPSEEASRLHAEAYGQYFAEQSKKARKP